MNLITWNGIIIASLLSIAISTYLFSKHLEKILLIYIERGKRIESKLKRLEPKLEELMKKETELASLIDEIDKEVDE